MFNDRQMLDSIFTFNLEVSRKLKLGYEWVHSIYKHCDNRYTID